MDIMFVLARSSSETPYLCFEKAMRLSRENLVFRVNGDLHVLFPMTQMHLRVSAKINLKFHVILRSLIGLFQ